MRPLRVEGWGPWAGMAFHVGDLDDRRCKLFKFRWEIVTIIIPVQGIKTHEVAEEGNAMEGRVILFILDQPNSGLNMCSILNYSTPFCSTSTFGSGTTNPASD